MTDRIITKYEYEGSAAKKINEPYKEKNRRKQKRGKAFPKAYSVGRGYVIFLVAVCLAVAASCVVYLNQKATITVQYDDIAVLESEYVEIKNNNDAKYNQVIDSVSLENIKDAAQKKLGMSYAGSGQVIYYDLEDDSYVRQYKDVPSE